MRQKLEQTELEELSAYCDGELDADRAARVERLIAAEPPWRQAHRELVDLDALLETWAVRPADDRLAYRAIRRVETASRPRPLIVRVLAASGSAAAVAAMILAMVALTRPRPHTAVTPPTVVKRGVTADDVAKVSVAQKTIDNVLKDVPVDDRLIQRGQ